jgi:hypothetical protein
LKDLTENGIIEEMGNDPDKNEMGTAFINPIIIIPKGNIIKLVIDARYLNSITDLSLYSWPLEALEVQLNRIHGEYFSVTDMSCAYHQVPLDEETQQLVSFVIGDCQLKFVRGFYGLSGLPNYFSRIMTMQFKSLIQRKDALAYLDDLLLMSDTKDYMFQIIDEFHDLLRQSGMKAAPDKTEFFLRKVKYLGHMISGQGISPVESRIKALKEMKTPCNKKDVMRVIGCFNFYSKYIKNLYVDCKPLFELTRNNVKFEWTEIHDKIFNDIKDKLTADTALAVPNTKYPFYIHVDSSCI